MIQESIPRPYLDLLNELGTQTQDHSDRHLSDHLMGTYYYLKQWGNDDHVCVAGLFHSIYGTQWYGVESVPFSERSRISAVIGEEAEALAYLFCASDRAQLWENPGADEVIIRSRIGQPAVVPAAMRRALLEIEVANIVEQLERTGAHNATVLRRLDGQIRAFEGELSRGAYLAAMNLLSQHRAEPAGAPDASVLERLLAPVSPDVFVAEFWGRRPLHVAGRDGKFAALFSLERFESALLKNAALTVRASFDGGRTHIRAEPGDAMALYKAGATICVNDIAKADPALSHFAATVRSQLSFIGDTDVRAYLSPDEQGYATHFDARIATTLQISGRKRWRFSRETALPWPHYQVRSGTGDTLATEYQFQQPVQEWERFRPPDDCTFDEVVLEPGDLLCLPAGTWHSARAIGHSFALNLAFGAAGAWEVLEPAIASQLRTFVPWREPPPVMPSRGFHRGALPEPVDQFLKDRIEELIHVLQHLARDPTSLNQSWHRLLVHRSGSTGFTAPPRNPAERPLTPETKLKRTTRETVAYGFGLGPQGERVVLLYGAAPTFEIAYSPNVLPFFQRLFEASEFTAGETRAWKDEGREYSWESARTLLGDLLEHGVIEGSD